MFVSADGSTPPDIDTDLTIIVVSLTSLITSSWFGPRENRPMINAVKKIHQLQHQIIIDRDYPYVFIADAEDITPFMAARVRSVLSNVGDNRIILHRSVLERVTMSTE